MGFKNAFRMVRIQFFQGYIVMKVWRFLTASTMSPHLKSDTACLTRLNPVQANSVASERNPLCVQLLQRPDIHLASL